MSANQVYISQFIQKVSFNKLKKFLVDFQVFWKWIDIMRQFWFIYGIIFGFVGFSRT